MLPNKVSFITLLINMLIPSLFVNYVPGTPSTLSTMNATALRRIVWEKKLREESVRPSVFEQLKSAIKVVDGVINLQKAGVYLEISVPPDSGQSVRTAMVRPLQKAPRYGTSEDVLGNEDEQTLLWTELFYNEVKKGVKFKSWGYDYNDTKYLKFVQQNGPALINFMAENRDTRQHQALLLTYAEELTRAPVSKAQQFNKNWCIPNHSETDMPAWDVTDLTIADGAADTYGYYSSRLYSGATSFVENICEKLMAAAGTGTTSKALMNVEAMALISYYLVEGLLMDPVMLDGIPSFVILMHPRVKSYAMNPNRSGSLGNNFLNVADYKDPKRATLIGEIGRVFENLVFCTDYRAPSLVVGGAAGSYTLKPGFVYPGNVDGRNGTQWANTSGATNYVFDVCIALGANALAQYLVDPLTTNLAESTEYGKIQGRAAYVGEGFQIPAWDKDAGSRLDGANTTQIQRGSCIIPVSRTPIVNVT